MSYCNQHLIVKDSRHIWVSYKSVRIRPILSVGWSVSGSKHKRNRSGVSYGAIPVGSYRRAARQSVSPFVFLSYITVFLSYLWKELSWPLESYLERDSFKTSEHHLFHHETISRVCPTDPTLRRPSLSCLTWVRLRHGGNWLGQISGKHRFVE
jgi:hypothetical protein